jgi:hypothetical protein
LTVENVLADISRELMEVESMEEIVNARKKHLRERLFNLLDTHYGRNERAVVAVPSTGRKIGRLKVVRKDSIDAAKLQAAVGETWDHISDWVQQLNHEKLRAFVELGKISRDVVEECRIDGRVSYSLVHQKVHDKDEED